MTAIRKYIKSNPNAICDICGRKRKWSEVTLAYASGNEPVVVSCLDKCADARQPLNSPPPLIFDGTPIPNARPDATDDNKEIYVPYISPSYLTWGHFKYAGLWGTLNNPNNTFNFNGMWTWGSFLRV